MKVKDLVPVTVNKEVKAIFDFFISAPAEMMEKPWRVYGNRSHCLLCFDYRNLTTSGSPLALMEGIDSMEKLHRCNRDGIR